MARAGAAICDVVTMNPGCQINGVIGIWNLSGITTRHVKELLKNGQLWAVVSLMLVRTQILSLHETNIHVLENLEGKVNTPRQKSIRALEIFRVQKLILNATS